MSTGNGLMFEQWSWDCDWLE